MGIGNCNGWDGQQPLIFFFSFFFNVQSNIEGQVVIMELNFQVFLKVAITEGGLSIDNHQIMFPLVENE